MELGDDTMYLVKGLGFICFQMPSSDVFELDSIFYVTELTKSLL